MKILKLKLGFALAIMIAIPAFAGEEIKYKSTEFDTSVELFLRFNSECKCLRGMTQRIDCRSTSSTYSGLRARSTMASFIQNKLYHVEIELVEDAEEYKALQAFGEVERALISKYGEPTRTTHHMGSMEREISVWKFGGISMQLSRGKTDIINIVGVMIGRDDYWQRSMELRSSQAKKDI